MRQIISIAKGPGAVAFGSMATAGANFLMALVLIPALPPRDYGLYAFTLVVVQLFFNVSNALTATPIASEIASSSLSPDRIRTYSGIAAIVSLAAALCALLNSALLGVEYQTTLFICGFVFFSTLRWYGRTYCFSATLPARSITSDFFYAGLLSSIAALFYFLQSKITLTDAMAAVTIASMCAMLPFWGTGLFGSFRLPPKPIDSYWDALRKKGGWALAAVAISELTVNSHVYLVTFTKGPEAYATLAIAALLFRPTATVISALGQSERPKIARLLRLLDLQGLWRSLAMIRDLLLGATGLNFIAAFVVLIFMQRLNFIKYNLTELAIGAAAWLLIMIARSIRVPSTLLCQSAGKLRDIARVGYFSAPASLIVVAIALVAFESPIWSLAGVLLGDFMLLRGTSRVSDVTKDGLTRKGAQQ